MYYCKKTVIGGTVVMAGFVISLLLFSLPRLAPQLSAAYLIILSTTFFISSVFCWALSIRHRMIIPSRFLLLEILVSFILANHLLSISKGCFFPFPPINRRIMYMATGPFMAMPPLTLLIALKVYSHKKPPLWFYAVCFIDAVIVLLIMTNDYHRLMLTPLPGGSPNHYRYLSSYFICVLFMYAQYVLAFLILHAKNRVHTRPYILFPIVLTGIGTGYMIYHANLSLFSLDVFFSPMTMFSAFLIAALEFCIQFGYIPANNGYYDFFGMTSVPAEMADMELDPFLHSPEALSLTPEQKRRALQGSYMLDDRIRVNGRKVWGGAFFWADNLGALQPLDLSLNRTAEQLQNENTLLQKENSLTKRRIQAAEKDALYTRMTQRLAPHFHRIAALIEEELAAPDQRRFARVCIQTAALKRLGTLMLNQGNAPAQSSWDLYAAIKECAEFFPHAGVGVHLHQGKTASLPDDQIINCFHAFQHVVLDRLEHLAHVSIALYLDEGRYTVHLRLQYAPGHEPQIPRVPSFDGIEAAMTPVRNGHEITLTMAQEGFA